MQPRRRHHGGARCASAEQFAELLFLRVDAQRTRLRVALLDWRSSPQTTRARRWSPLVLPDASFERRDLLFGPLKGGLLVPQRLGERRKLFHSGGARSFDFHMNSLRRSEIGLKIGDLDLATSPRATSRAFAVRTLEVQRPADEVRPAPPPEAAPQLLVAWSSRNISPGG